MEQREYNAEYYDIATTQTDDTEFYKQFVDESKTVLELGCGSGRCSLPLAALAKSYVGVDLSRSMLVAARKKDRDSSVEFVEGDISNIHLGRQFDFVVAPFRVLQCLEEPDDVRGFFRVVGKHLAKDGAAIINVFNPKFSKEEMPTKWIRDDETAHGEYTLASGDVLKVGDSRKKLNAEKQVLYPKMIYRRYSGGVLVETHVNPICMRYWYPDDFKELVLDEGFAIKECWGGYTGQIYGEGGELVLHFGHGS